MVQRGHEVTAVCFDGINGEPRFELDSRVHLVDAGFTPPPLALRKSIIELRVPAHSFQEKTTNTTSQAREASVMPFSLTARYPI